MSLANIKRHKLVPSIEIAKSKCHERKKAYSSLLVLFIYYFDIFNDLPLQALDELQLINWIGDQISEVIKQVETGRLAVAILLILWVSAIVSSFIDNIPYTTAMVSLLH